MAKKPPSPSRKPGQSHEPDDAFLARVLELSTWARERTQLLVAAGVAVLLLALGVVYYVNLQITQTREAEQELERLQQVVAMAEPEEGKQELRNYLTRFGDTRFAHEARLTLAELHLHEGETEEAIDVLEPSRGALRDPVGIQAVFLLGTALEEAGRWNDAEVLYLDLADQVELRFQRKDALEGAARSRVEQEDALGAAELYRQILAELEQDDPRRARYEMRVAELEATAGTS